MGTRAIVSFQEWMRAVDSEMLDVAGVVSSDIGDWRYRDAFDDGVSAREAALEALEDDDLYGALVRADRADARRRAALVAADADADAVMDAQAAYAFWGGSEKRMLDRLVDREHVSRSPFGVARLVLSLMRREVRSDPEFRGRRRAAMAYAVARHWANRDVYAVVVRGLPRWPR